MPLLNSIAYKMRKFPILKKIMKLSYQYVGNLLSDKKTIPNSITQISSSKEEHLFGYYDKCPWNKDENKVIYLQVTEANKNYASSKQANIILKDLLTEKEQIIATTNAWNVQQGCMLQWLGPDFNSKIFYNDFIDGKLKSVILNIDNLEKKIIDYPLYSIDKTGKWGLSLDFYRLNRLRPGYGYNNKGDETSKELLPKGYCIWKVDLESNTSEGIISYEQLYNIDLKDTMKDAEHKVNHIMINPSGTRFMFLHRWIKNKVKYTRLLTADTNGKDIFNLLDNDMVSHCNWKDDKTILCWAQKEEKGTHYFLLKDKTSECNIIAKEKLFTDGHPSYSPDGKWFVTDTYPDFRRKQHIYIYNEKEDKIIEIATVYANINYNGDCRCDLHPRWNYSGNKICFDGAQKNKRQVYSIDVGDIV